VGLVARDQLSAQAAALPDGDYLMNVTMNPSLPSWRTNRWYLTRRYPKG